MANVVGRTAPVFCSIFLAVLMLTASAHGFDCGDCHGSRSPRDYRPIDSLSRDSSTGGFQGNHRTHIGPTTDAAVCEKCHSGSANYTNAHQDQWISLSSNINSSPQQAIYRNTTSAFPQTPLPSLGACSSVNCHFESDSPSWGSASYNSEENCSSCHYSPGTSSSHARHDTFYPFASSGCIHCHPDYKSGLLFSHATSAGKRGIIVRLAEGTYSGSGRDFLPSQRSQKTFGECRNVYCHSDGKGVFSTPTWGDAPSGRCGSCHGNPATSFAHPAHLTAPYGPKFGTDPTGMTNCSRCHLFTGETAPTHVNRTVDTPTTSCSGCHPSQTVWRGGRVTCESCHSGERLSAIDGVSAPDKRLATAAGHGKSVSSVGSPMAVSCPACHDPDSSHIGNTARSSRLSPLFAGGANTECIGCHNDPAKVPTARFRNMSTHFLRKIGPQEMRCQQCHDPHGTDNLSMIRSRIVFRNASATISFRNISTGLIDTVSNVGLCQLCHTQTKYYRAGVAETAHLKKNCISCHPHNAPDGAFRPVDGNCDTCHGYPPIPSTTPFGPPDPKLLGYQPEFRGFGTFNNWTYARYEDYSGGGGVHLDHVNSAAKVSEGWANCNHCHDNGRSHKKILPRDGDWRSQTYGIMGNITVKIDPRYNFFGAPFSGYTGAKLINRPARNVSGSCMGTCHGYGPTPTWDWEGFYDVTPPAQITGLTATATSVSAISLSWSPGSDAGGSGLWGYLLERAEDVGGSPGAFAQIGRFYPNVTSTSSTGLATNTRYWFRVRAFDGNGNLSPYSTAVPTATLTADPVGAYFNMGTGKITVAWSSGGTQTGYRVFRDGDRSVGTQVYNGTATTFDDPVTGSHLYYVYSTNREGTVSSGFSKTLPTTPSMTGAAFSPTSIKWTLNTNGTSAYGYKIHTTDHLILLDGLVMPTLNWIIDTTYMSPNTRYTKHIHSFNAAGDSAPSADVSVYTLAASPDVTVERTPGTNQVVFSSRVNFGFGGVSYYRYVWDRNPTYSGWNDTESRWEFGTLPLMADQSGNWYLHVRSYNAADVPSDSRDFGPYNMAGTAPTGLANSSPSNGAALQPIGTPLKVSAAVDGLGGAVEYHFEVATDSSFTQNVQNSGWLPGSSYYPLLAANTTYYWRVKARGAIGLVSTPFTGYWSFSTSDASRVVYSVGQNTSDHKTGTPLVTVSGTTATFSVPQTATNLGVGDRVTYGGQNVCFLSGKISSSIWNCVTATGGVPVSAVNAQVVSVTHAFSSLDAAIGESSGAFDATHLGTSDLVSGKYQLNIPCYYDSGAEMTGGIIMYAPTTSSANTIRIYTPYDTATEVNRSQRHDGRWKTDAYRLQSNDNYGIHYTVPYVEIEGLQVVYGQSGGIMAYYNGAGKPTWIHDNLVTFKAPSWMPDMNGGAGIEAASELAAEAPTGYIYNNIVYDITMGTGIRSEMKGAVYNNTVYNAYYGFYAYFGKPDRVMNNIFQQSTVGITRGYQPAAVYDYNITNDATATGSHSKPSTTVSFVSVENKDFHLSAGDSAARNSGADLSAAPTFSFNLDIDRQARPSGLWDIGADEGMP